VLVAEFRMPSLGADMEAGTLVEWLVKPGDQVKRGDIIAVVETQKGAIEIEVFEAGRIEQILVGVDSKVPVGTPLALIRGEAEIEVPRAAVSAAAPPIPTHAPVLSAAKPIVPAAGPAIPIPGMIGRVRVSPAARQLAAARGGSRYRHRQRSRRHHPAVGCRAPARSRRDQSRAEAHNRA
jgi:pyruvate dehydrogenase E2 component (dihydrolipoamide acetyltransferase)